MQVVGALAAAVVCHEAGHFFCARSVGLPSLEFSLGFGPQVLSLGRDAGGTEFSLRALPIGGYVRFNDAKTIRLEDGTMVNEFEALPPLARIWVLAGGVLANMVTAWSTLVASISTIGISRRDPLPGIKVEALSEEAAARTGLHVNDVLLRIGSRDLNAPNQSVQQTVDYIRQLPAQKTVEVLVDRGGQQVTLNVQTITDPNTGLQRLGATIQANYSKVMVKVGSVMEAAGAATDTVERLISDDWQALQGLFNGGGGAEFVGPVGMVQNGQQLASSEGLIGLVLFFVGVNLNLAVINALPIPSLDGGRAFFVLVEQVTRKRLEESRKQDVEYLFILLVLAGVLSLTAKDITKLFVDK